MSGEIADPAEEGPPAAHAGPSATGSIVMPSEMPGGPGVAGRVGSSPAGGIVDGGAVNREDTVGSVQGR
ncbi:MAG: hypothetical protein F4X65_13325 [Chloroflexi bacterium]|nr:hypothetical protein [Chloroflexota bacterium]